MKRLLALALIAASIPSPAAAYTLAQGMAAAYAYQQYGPGSGTQAGSSAKPLPGTAAAATPKQCEDAAAKSKLDPREFLNLSVRELAPAAPRLYLEAQLCTANGQCTPMTDFRVHPGAGTAIGPLLYLAIGCHLSVNPKLTTLRIQQFRTSGRVLEGTKELPLSELATRREAISLQFNDGEFLATPHLAGEK